MSHHTLRPNPPGGHGERSVLDTSVHPPRVVHAHIEIDNWFGEDLFTVFPIYLVTDRLAAALTESGMRDFTVRDAEITIQPEARELASELNLPGFPTFRWLDITGTAGHDDIGVTTKKRLVVSQQALELLQRFNLEGCDVDAYNPTAHD